MLCETGANGKRVPVNSWNLKDSKHLRAENETLTAIKVAYISPRYSNTFSSKGRFLEKPGSDNPYHPKIAHKLEG